MTSPQALPPHQDPTHNDDPQRVTIMEYVTTIVAQLDRRFDTLHQDLKDSITDRFAAVYRAHSSLNDRYEQRFAEQDLRYQQRFDAQSDALKAAFIAQETATQAALAANNALSETQMAAAEKAVEKAERANEKRFDGVNEFRGQLSDQAATFIPRIEAEQRIAALSEKIDILRQAASIDTGRSAGVGQSWGVLLGAAGLASAVIGIIVGTR